MARYRDPLATGNRRWTRDVTRETHDRCLAACSRHKDQLTDGEVFTLSAIASAWATDLPVNKSDLDHAMGILGRFPNLIPGVKR
jgi:hypothetical protein